MYFFHLRSITAKSPVRLPHHGHVKGRVSVVVLRYVAMVTRNKKAWLTWTLSAAPNPISLSATLMCP